MDNILLIFYEEVKKYPRISIQILDYLEHDNLAVMDVVLSNLSEAALSINAIKLDDSDRLIFLRDRYDSEQRELDTNPESFDFAGKYLSIDPDDNPGLFGTEQLPQTPYLLPKQSIRGIIGFEIGSDETKLKFEVWTTARSKPFSQFLNRDEITK